ncbi:quinon protein alcohol dehydrogenase-like superfamily [Cokeromyces recurvatus]|uniref:quinon protein alcohol dehydrogenase-like superfamily n=1 Tax=Cokeromyces recurvatus TaxID=90255 RepID=UPI00221E5384|nr:quinon protein alcohol dehydrogenase-like superfamily [Cokeromyces recurvatus]KAI7901524.1 quinon protein alcohol dehydrogenase-like superfamily [Cokeromyces recurvatus]
MSLAKTENVASVNNVENNTHKKYGAPNKIVLSKYAAGNISEYPIEFTKDSKYFFSSTGSCVKIFSTATGAIVKSLSQSPALGGHSKKITRVILNPKNHLQLYTASLDGTIKLWDYNDDILLKTYNVNAPIQCMVMSPEAPGHAYIVVKSGDGKDKLADNSIVYRFSFGSSDEPTQMRRICSLRDCNTIDITNDGKWLAFGARYKVYVWEINQDTEDVPETQLKEHIFAESITVLKFHPFKPILAVGDRSGQITLITNYISNDKKDYIRSILHWHHLYVRSLIFMADGSYLLSGGGESVMVIWQLDTGHKQFLPRLGGAIDSITISPNHRFYCVGLEDNSIRLINSITQNIEQVIQGLQYAHADNASNPLSTGLIVEPRNHHVVLNGVQGSIQFYDAISDSHVMNLEVMPVNRIVRSGERDVIHGHVAHVAFLRSGEWMATVDMRDDKVTTPELFLKFWRWDPDTQAYKLHTRVDYPHTKPITSVTFNPISRHGPMAITTSEDKTFKVWNLSTGAGRNSQVGADAAWICRSVGVYRDVAPTVAAFSEDGSILAVAFEQAITLWDPYLNSIQAVFAQPNPEDVTFLSFLGDNSPFLVAKTMSHLYVWNILTCKVWWSYKILVDHLAIDKVSNRIAIACNHIACNQTRIIVFDAKSPKPIALQHVDYKCLSMAWLPKEQNENKTLSSALICLNHKYEIAIHTIKPRTTVERAVNSQTETEKEDANTLSMINNDRSESGLLDGMYGKRETERESEEETRIRLKTAQALREEAMSANRKDRASKRREEGDMAGMSAPSHVLPNVESLFDSFMSSLMTLRIDALQQEDTTLEVMDIDTKVLDDQSTIEDNSLLNDDITKSAKDDFPSLSSYFTQELDKAPVQKKPIVQQQDSSSDSDSDEEDPSNIEW